MGMLLPPFDHHLLLVGTNPLPPYVSAKYFLHNSSQITLLHTGTTGSFSHNIRNLLGTDTKEENPNQKLDIREVEIDVSNPYEIKKSVYQIIKKISPNAVVSFNYTGGTKPMAVACYELIRSCFPNAYFSYLDARQFALILEQKDLVDPIIIPYNKAPLKFTSLLTLHGYHIDISTDHTIPKCVETCAALASQIDRDADAWRFWCDRNLRRMKYLPQGWKEKFQGMFPDQNLLNDNVCEKVEEFLRWVGSDSLETRGQLKKVEIHDFPEVFESLRTNQNMTVLEDFYDQTLFSGFDKFGKFLDGEWLEHYTLSCLLASKSKSGIHECFMDIVSESPNPHQFQLDVIAMKGYQLFVISCTTSTDLGLNKSKLFEAYIRSKQIGGEEARFAVVSAYSVTEKLERELREAWQSDNSIRVFGAKDLLGLADRLADWINIESLYT